MAGKFSIYKYCRTDAGWRYCKAVFHPNGKIKPNIVLVRERKKSMPKAAISSTTTTSGSRSATLKMRSHREIPIDGLPVTRD
jgi:hypothetical protein